MIKLAEVSNADLMLLILHRAGGSLSDVALEERFYAWMERVGRPYDRGDGTWHVPARRTLLSRGMGGNGKDYVLTISCPHCGREHTHGGGTDEEPAYGHRRAHCNIGGEYYLYPAPGTYPEL